jgi:hypothetical protein
MTEVRTKSGQQTEQIWTKTGQRSEESQDSSQNVRQKTGQRGQV